MDTNRVGKAIAHLRKRARFTQEISALRDDQYQGNKQAAVIGSLFVSYALVQLMLTVPVTVSVTVPGVQLQLPSVPCAKVAAGTVIAPGVVVRTPSVSS